MGHGLSAPVRAFLWMAEGELIVRINSSTIGRDGLKVTDGLMRRKTDAEKIITVRALCPAARSGGAWLREGDSYNPAPARMRVQLASWTTTFKVRGAIGLRPIADRQVQLRTSAKGWAALFLKAKPWTPGRRCLRHDYEAAALAQGHVAVNSILRDWIKGQVTAIECGILSFEAVFLPFMLTADGRPLSIAPWSYCRRRMMATW